VKKTAGCPLLACQRILISPHHPPLLFAIPLITFFPFLHLILLFARKFQVENRTVFTCYLTHSIKGKRYQSWDK